MKKTICILLTLALILSLGTAALAADKPAVVLSPQKLIVDGEAVKCDVYNIDGSNYFKLRDVAALVNGSDSQFSVGWDAEAGVVSVRTGEPYMAFGTELNPGTDKSATAVKSAQTVMIDGAERSDLSVFNIGGNNFFKLRDLGAALNFDVDFDAAANTAIVKSRGTKLYTRDFLMTGYSYSTDVYDGDPATGTQVYSYDDARRMTEYTYSASEGDSGSVKYTYDADGRLSGIDSATGFGEFFREFHTAYTYDAEGKKLTMVDSDSAGESATTTYAYDEAGRLISEVTEDPAGDYRTSNTYTYHPDGTMTHVWCSEPFKATTVYTYDDAGREIKAVRTEDSPSGISVSETVTEYDSHGNVTKEHTVNISGNFAGDETIDAYENTYDAYGMLTRMVKAHSYITAEDLEGGTFADDPFITVNDYTYDTYGNLLGIRAEDDYRVYTNAYTYDYVNGTYTETYTSVYKDL